MHFNGKVVLVTGASAGIGATTAITFAKLGAKLALVARNADNLKATEAACQAVNPISETLQIVADITVDAERIINSTLQKFGKLNVLVNNAAMFAYGAINDADVKQFDDILNTNLRAVFLLTQLAVPHLIATQGNIVNVSSTVGLRAFPNTISYATSKAALDQLTRCAALDLAKENVRVNGVNAGLIDTDILLRSGMSAKARADYFQHAQTTIPLGRVGTTQNVADAIVFLACEEQASYLTGVNLPVDGGKQLMCPR